MVKRNSLKYKGTVVFVGRKCHKSVGLQLSAELLKGDFTN